ncbi:MAG: DUF45 domain-containing protein [Betaproteobacteria bacterium]|nr:DUF45 domain-containing protein [Betaproteobacteria bacterium]
MARNPPNYPELGIQAKSETAVFSRLDRLDSQTDYFRGADIKAIQKGFTLIELMIIVAIIGLRGAGGTPVDNLRAEVIPYKNPETPHRFRRRGIKKWEPELRVKMSGYFLQRMKIKWGSCNHRAGHIRLNTELVKKPKDLLEYVIVHEMVHLLEPTHSERFMDILGQNYPV